MVIVLREPDDDESGWKPKCYFAAFFRPCAAHNTPGQTVIQIGIGKALRDFNRCGLCRGNHPHTRLKSQKLGAFRCDRSLNDVLLIEAEKNTDQGRTVLHVFHHTRKVVSYAGKNA